MILFFFNLIAGYRIKITCWKHNLALDGSIRDGKACQLKKSEIFLERPHKNELFTFISSLLLVPHSPSRFTRVLTVYSYSLSTPEISK